MADEEYDEPSEEQQQQEQTPAPAPAPLDDIFGDNSDSELSDVESDNENAPHKAAAQRAASRSASPSSRRSSSPRRSPTHSAAGSGDEDDGDDYREEGLKKLKIKRKPRAERPDGETPKNINEKVKRAQTKEVEEEPEEEVVDEATARRRALDARLEAIIKKPKKTGGKKKRGEQEDDLEAMNDEAVAKLRVDMFNAADRDIEENESGRFASHKLRMLPTVVDMMQKTTLAESLVESGALEAVKRWLEPLPDKSLPALNIQRPLFEILRTLSIETSALKSSGLGKIVYFYTKCKRVDPFIARMANQLVSDWMRPIIRRSKAFSDKELGTTPAHYSSEMIAQQRVKQARESNIARKLEAEGSQGSAGGAVARRHARIPASLSTSFKVAPAADPRQRPERAGGAAVSSNVATGTKMKSYKKKLVAGQQASRRV